MGAHDDEVARQQNGVTIPADLVPYVAMGLRVALSELRARANEQRESLTTPEAKKVPKLIRMGIEGSANQADELRATMIQAYRSLPDALRPREDLMTMPGDEKP
jgi:hypothetical protein